MEVTWDENKNRANFKKHGVWFNEASSVFWDLLRKEVPDFHLLESRWIVVGISKYQRLLLVSYVEKDEETIRIISARRLTKKERNNYEEGI